MQRLQLIKGGKTVDLTQQVNLKFGQLFSRAAYYKKKKEQKELKLHFLEYAVESNEHLLLLEIFKKYDFLMELNAPPLKFIGESIEKIDLFLEQESKKPLKASNCK